MVGAAVGQVVARHRRDDDVAQAEPESRLGDAVRLIGAEVFRRAPGYGAKAAGSRAHAAQDHERGGAAGVTLRAVGAAGVLAHRFEPQFTQQLVREQIPVAHRQRALEPWGQAFGVGAANSRDHLGRLGAVGRARVKDG